MAYCPGSACDAFLGPYFCTRNAGHEGDHIAHGDADDEAIARWVRDEDEGEAK